MYEFSARCHQIKYILEPKSFEMDSSNPPFLPPSPKRRKRLLKNSCQAKASRCRKQTHLLSLELQVRQLTAQAKQLRTVGAYPEMFPGEFGEELFSLFQRLEAMVAQQDTSERAIEEVLEECRDTVGVQGSLRTQTLKETFHRTVLLMIPEYLQSSLVIAGKEQFSPDFLTSREISVYQECAKHCQEQYSAVQSALEAFQSETAVICHSADILNSTIEGLRPLLSPRQMALFAIWIKKYYIGLSPQQVLSDGRNCTQLLNID